MSNQKTGSHPGAADEMYVVHQDRRFRVAIKRVASAKRFTLRVRSATQDVVMSMPARASLVAAQDFANRNAGWIAVRLARLPDRKTFAPLAEIPYRGTPHVLLHCPRPPQGTGPVWVDASHGQAVICASGDLPHFERRITDFLRREARREIEASVRTYVDAVGRAPVSVTLKDTTSRWGSCSARGALNFSWRLILAPPFVLDYLVAHEMAHLKHHDHSRDFWRLTKQICPETDRAEAWLDFHGKNLHGYGPARTSAGE
jgi:predicted metal-dependent hydrolase